MKNLLLVCGFGQVDEERDFFQKYLAGIEDSSKEYAIDILLCSGGYTGGSDLPSEAMSLKNSLVNRGYTGPIELEERAFSSFDNIKYGAEAISSSFTDIEKIVVCTANTHVYKIAYLGLRLLSSCLGKNIPEYDVLHMMQQYFLQHADHARGEDVTIDFGNIIFVGIDVGFPAEQVRKQIIAALLEPNYIRYEKLHDEFIAWRKGKWGIAS